MLTFWQIVHLTSFIQNTDILVTLENTSAENKGLDWIAYNNIESSFPYHVFDINFDEWPMISFLLT